MLKKTGCPEVIRHSETIFSKLVEPQIRDTLTTDIRTLSVLLNGEENDEIADGLVERVSQTLPADLRSVFTLAGMDTTSRGHLLPNFLINGLFYSISSKHAGNSCVLFSPAVGQQLVPARIIYIVQIMDSSTLSTYLAVRRHKALDGISDPYLRSLFCTHSSGIHSSMMGWRFSYLHRFPRISPAFLLKLDKGSLLLPFRYHAQYDFL